MKKVIKWLFNKCCHDKRIWFCVVAYPIMFFAADRFKHSNAFKFLLKQSPTCFLVLFFVFIVEAFCLVMEIWSSSFALKAQGGKLRIKEKDGQNDEEKEE